MGPILLVTGILLEYIPAVYPLGDAEIT